MRSNTNSVVAVFESHDQAENAIRELQKDGFDMKKLSIVGKDFHTEEHVVGYYTTGDRMLYWGKLGAFWGGFWGLLGAAVWLRVLLGAGHWPAARGRAARHVDRRRARRGRRGGRDQRPRRRPVQHRHSEEQRRAIRDRGEERQTPPGRPRNGRRGGTGQGPPASESSEDDDGSCRTGRRWCVTGSHGDIPVLAPCGPARIRAPRHGPPRRHEGRAPTAKPTKPLDM